MLPDSGKYGRLGQAVNLRAVILTSEGERGAKINQAEGEKQRVIKESEAAKQYINEFGNLAKSGNTLVVPANLANMASMIALATNIAKSGAGTAREKGA